MVDEGLTGLLAVPGQDVEHARRQPSFEGELPEAERGQGSVLGGLQNDRASGSQGRGDLPYCHQQRVVPRNDLRHNADRLALGSNHRVGD